MDKAEWQKRLKHLKDMYEINLKDREDYELMISAYETKIASL